MPVNSTQALVGDAVERNQLALSILSHRPAGVDTHALAIAALKGAPLADLAAIEQAMGEAG